MSVAIAWPELKYLDDVNVTVGVGVDEYALTYDHDTAKFVLRAPADLSGYALLAGRAGGQTLYGGTAANDDITIHGTSNGTRATSYVLLQPSGGRVGIGTSAPGTVLHVVGSIADDLVYYQNTLITGWNGFSLRNSSDVQVGFFSSGNASAVSWPGQVVLGTNGSVPLLLATNQTERVRVLATGNVGIGTTAPATQLHVTSTTATTDAVRNVLTIGSNVTGAGVGAAGLGAGLLFQAESTTTADSDMAQIGALWTTATHATRASALTFSTLTAGGSLTERMRIDGAGNVGIGAPSRGATLYVYRTGNAKINVIGEHPGLEYGNVAATLGARTWMNSSSGDLYFDVASSGSWRTGIQIVSSGSAAAIGFLGAAPQARILHVADPAGGATVDAEARSAINSILATLENFGFHATS